MNKSNYLQINMFFRNKKKITIKYKTIYKKKLFFYFTKIN